MNRGLIIAMMGLSMLYAHTVSATEMQRHDSTLLVADAGGTNGKHKTYKHRRHDKHHHHKHHHHKHPARQHCPDGRCAQPQEYMRQEAVMMPAPALDQVEENMDILNRDHGVRAAGGR